MLHIKLNFYHTLILCISFNWTRYMYLCSVPRTRYMYLCSVPRIRGKNTAIFDSPPFGRVTVNGLGKCLSVCVWPRCTSRTGHSWTSILGMYTLLWSGKSEHSFFSTIPEAIEKGQIGAASVFQALPASNKARVLYHWLS